MGRRCRSRGFGKRPYKSCHRCKCIQFRFRWRLVDWDTHRPLGDLVEPVKKWNYVKVPEGIDSSLKQLADGVNAFSFSFMSGWSLDTLVGPLGDLADAARKWNGVTLEGVSQELTSFADSLKNLGTVSVSGSCLNFKTLPEH